MLYIKLNDLPPSKKHKPGFPWTEQTIPNSDSIDKDLEYPLISIITPSYNQGEFIEETIRSVLLQNYPNLEYIIIDGGSTDNTIDIIKQYEKYLNYWVSEPDRGQSHAINKGLQKSSGQIWAYLNSDDFYHPGTLFKVAKAFLDLPELVFVTGYGSYINLEEEVTKEFFPDPNQSLKDILIPWKVKHPVAIQMSNFMSHKVLQKYGFFNESYHYCMDFDYGLRLIADGVRPYVIDSYLASARVHDSSKTVNSHKSGSFASKSSLAETIEIIEKYLNYLSPKEKLYVQNELTQYKYFHELMILKNCLQEIQGINRLFLLRDFITKNPEYIFHKSTLALLKRIVLQMDIL